MQSPWRILNSHVATGMGPRIRQTARRRGLPPSAPCWKTKKEGDR